MKTAEFFMPFNLYFYQANWQLRVKSWFHYFNLVFLHFPLSVFLNRGND